MNATFGILLHISVVPACFLVAKFVITMFMKKGHHCTVYLFGWLCLNSTESCKGNFQEQLIELENILYGYKL